jgi:transcriptional regulator
MYIPKHFEQKDIAELTAFIKCYSFAIVVCDGVEGLEAHHLPLYLVEMSTGRYRLKGHIAKANALWQRVNEESSVLVIFQGPQSYISPSLYPSKKEHGKVVPTWNYASVHGKGKINFVHDAQWKLV